MNLTLNTFHYPAQPDVRGPMRTGPVSRPGENSQQNAVPSPLPASSIQKSPVDLEYRAQQYRQHNFSNGQLPSRNQQAIQSYNSITESEQRARVSELFGLNEYA